MYDTYLRLDIKHDSWRAVVRAASRKLTHQARCDATRWLPHARCFLRNLHPSAPPDQRCGLSCLGAAHRMSTGKPFPLRPSRLA